MECRPFEGGAAFLRRPGTHPIQEIQTYLISTQSTLSRITSR